MVKMCLLQICLRVKSNIFEGSNGCACLKSNGSINLKPVNVFEYLVSLHLLGLEECSRTPPCQDLLPCLQ